MRDGEFSRLSINIDRVNKAFSVNDEFENPSNETVFFAGIFQKVPGDITNLRDRFSLGEVADRIRTVEGGQNGIAHQVEAALQSFVAKTHDVLILAVFKYGFHINQLFLMAEPSSKSLTTSSALKRSVRPQKSHVTLISPSSFTI